MMNVNKGSQKVAKTHRNIFANNFYMAAEYIKLIDALQEMDKIFNKKDGDKNGRRLSKQLLDFLKTNIQFKSYENLRMTMEDVVSFTKICAAQKNENLQKFGLAALEAASTLYTFSDQNLILGFNYVNVDALKELNLKKIAELEQEDVPDKEAKEIAKEKENLKPTKRK